MNHHNTHSFVPLGNRFVWGSEEAFGIGRDDRRRHIYCVGKTGSGKSTLIRNMVLHDIHNGEGVILFDPHGDLAEEVLAAVPRHRTNDTIYFNPSDLAHPIGFNVLADVDPDQQFLLADTVMEAFKNIWGDSWGARMDDIFRNAILSLLEYGNSTLLGVLRILTDHDYRMEILPRIQNPVLIRFWIDEFKKHSDVFQQQAISPVQNKVRRFLNSPVLRNIFGQTKCAIDFEKVMNKQQIFIANLSKGKIGADNASLLGSLLISHLQSSAMKRISIPETERHDCFLYVDEFHNFVTDSFATILSEMRKFRLSLFISHQYINQLKDKTENEKVLNAVFGNVGSMISFRVGNHDAERLSKEFEGEFPPEVF